MAQNNRPKRHGLTCGQANFVGPMAEAAAIMNKIHDGSFKPNVSAADLISQQLV